jgi:energy-coupling factor transporter ATP-binding protein EcfA2
MPSVTNSIEEKVLNTAIGLFITEISKSTKAIFGDLSNEVEQFFNKGLKQYLEKQKNEYAKLKTLLRGNSPVYLYDIYYPIKLQSKERVRKPRVVNPDYAGDLFKEGNYITIIGDAGSGKSTLIKHLFLNCIHRNVAIPILVELRYLNDYKNDINDYIFEKIFENKLVKNSDILNKLLENGNFAFFLDGFDELKADRKATVITALNSLINTYGKNRYIITTRPYSDIENLPLFTNLYVKELSYEEGDIDNFITKQLQAEQETADKIKKSIANNNSTYIKSFLVNPLLLSLYILTFQSNAEIPDKKYIFYRRVINALFSEHDSKTKLGFVRQQVSGLNQEQFEEILKLFCFISFFESEFTWDSDYINFTLTQVKTQIENIKFDNLLFTRDLKSAVALWVEDNGFISFAHRSLQEYFAALFVKTLPQASSEVLYKEIIEKFSVVTKVNDIANFLSLCEEMDTLNYNKYHYLPLLKELRGIIKGNNDKELVKSFIEFFVEEIQNNPERESPIRTIIRINKDIYKTFHIHFPFTQKLHHIMSRVNPFIFEASKKPSIDDINTESPSKSIRPAKKNSLKITKLDNNTRISKCPKVVLDHYFQYILEISKEFSKFLDLKILNTEDYITKKESIGIGVKALLHKKIN